MKINLITQNEYDTLLNIHKNHPVLTFINKGYEYIDKSKLTEQDNEALNKINEILKRSIDGFCYFNNFTIDKNNNIKLRFQYNWTAEEEGNNKLSFIGVGYIKINELLNGFDS